MNITYDELGPSYILNVYNPKNNLRAFVVVDNIARGVAIGGTRMASDVTVEEVFGLARAMTLKNAMADLKHGGAKSGIVADPRIGNKEELIRTFARAIKCINDHYLPGPDMGTDETCMAWIKSEGTESVGLPKEIGGLPLDEMGSTAYGLICAYMIMSEYRSYIDHDTVVIQGYGNVGRKTAEMLSEQGLKIIAVADSTGGIYKKDGLDLDELNEVKDKHGTVTKYPYSVPIKHDKLLTIECDVLVLAARPNAITMHNVADVKAKMILQGANLPIAPEVEAVLEEKGLLNMPDFVANAGGVITAAVEYAGGSEDDAYRKIRKTIKNNVIEVMNRSTSENITTRKAAMKIAKEKVISAMKYV